MRKYKNPYATREEEPKEEVKEEPQQDSTLKFIKFRRSSIEFWKSLREIKERGI